MMKATWLYVFGTLRPGHGNFRLIEDALLMEPFEDCLASGTMHHVRGSDSRRPVYPVVDFEEAGTVVGSLLLVDRAGIDVAHRMEVGAGYQPRLIPVQVPSWCSIQPLALAYHWPHVRRGPVVPGGDWNREADVYNRLDADVSKWG